MARPLFASRAAAAVGLADAGPALVLPA